MFHQEFGSGAILRNYLYGRNPLDLVVPDLPALIWVVSLIVGGLLGFFVHALGRGYARRVIRQFSLPIEVIPPGQGLRSVSLMWSVSGGVLTIFYAASGAGLVASVVGLGVCAVLAVLAITDWYTGLLPDELTLPLLWAGLAWSWLGYGIPVAQALGGVIVSYLFLMLVFKGYHALRRREGMGLGDFKLTAALGAWVGLPAVAELLLLSCVLGVLLALARAGFRGCASSFPFGPCLSLAGMLFLVVLPT